jgi:hypothetical protein
MNSLDQRVYFTGANPFFGNVFINIGVIQESGKRASSHGKRASFSLRRTAYKSDRGGSIPSDQDSEHKP